ncbi:hypothetical protein MMC06_005741 [Schaereria dolodes]|nr:hypothetical protein [Schaereria dolodes]
MTSPKKNEGNHSHTKPSAIKIAIVDQEHDDTSAVDNSWEAYRQAWSQRRKSAGEGLLKRTPIASTLQATVESSEPELNNENAQSRMAVCHPSACPRPVMSRKSAPRSFHVPLVSSSALSSANDIPTLSLPKSYPFEDPTAVANASIERLAGRYEGGLYFGYEPGFGLGGSAGTRSRKSGATRKSVDVSLGYGIDLSDVPIFVAPSQ